MKHIKSFPILENISTELKKVNSLEELSSMCQGKYLVIESNKRLGESNLRKKGMDGHRIYVLYNITPESAAIQEISGYQERSLVDTLRYIIEKKQVNQIKSENRMKYLIEFIKYNIRRKNQVYITDEFISQEDYNKILTPINKATEFRKDAFDIINEEGEDITENYPVSGGLGDQRKLKTVPKSAVLHRDSHGAEALTMIIGTVRNIYSLKYGNFVTLTEDDTRNYYGHSWLERTTGFSHFNRNFTITKLSSKFKRQVNNFMKMCVDQDKEAFRNIKEYLKKLGLDR